MVVYLNWISLILGSVIAFAVSWLISFCVFYDLCLSSILAIVVAIVWYQSSKPK